MDVPRTADFRELLEKQKDLDAVVVCTTDNLHAAVSAAAMKKRKHVFCQKPLTHTIYEARRMAEIAQADWRGDADCRRQSGLRGNAPSYVNGFGPARSVRCARFKTGPAGPSGRKASNARRNQNRCRTVWTGICGSGRRRNVLSTMLTCRSCGADGPTSVAARLGDMGSYSFDTIFRVLKLEAPLSVEASSTDRYEETYPLASIVRL